MTVTRIHSTTLRALVCVLSLAAAACTVNAAGKIPCADDSSCPTDYPVCTASFCVAGTPAANSAASISIIGLDGKTADQPVRQTVHMNVSARASSGVKSVSIAGGGKTYNPTTSAAPLYGFDIDTTQLTDGDVAFKATITPGDATLAAVTSGAFTLHVDNTPPTLSSTSTIPNAKVGAMVSVTVVASEPLSSIVGTITSGSTVVGSSTVSTPQSGLTYVVQFGVTENLATGPYTMTINAVDLAGNATSTPLTKTFEVVVPVLLASTNLKVSTAAGVKVGGVPAGSIGTDFSINLTIPPGLTPAANGVAFTLFAADNTHRSLLVAGAGSQFTSTYTVLSTDPQGVSTVRADVTDIAGNVSSTSAQVFFDMNPPSLGALTISPKFVLLGDTVVVSGIATKAISSATILTTNGDTTADSTGKCSCDGAACPSASAAPAISCSVVVSHLPGIVTATIALVDDLGNATPVTGTAALAFQAAYQIVAAPHAVSLVAQSSTISTGHSTLLTPTFDIGAGIQGVITADVGLSPGPVSTGIPVSISPLASTLYTLTVTGPASGSSSKSTAVTVVPLPTAGIVASQQSITLGQSVTITPTFTGANSVTIPGLGSGPFTSGTPISVSPGQTTVYTITATNAAQDSQSASVTVFVGAAPHIGGWATLVGGLTTAFVTKGGTLSLLPTFSNGNGQVTSSFDLSVSPVTSGTSFTVPSNVLNTVGSYTFTLSVANNAGLSVSAAVVVNVVAAPTCTGLSPATATITSGTAASLTPTFSNGVGTLTCAGTGCGGPIAVVAAVPVSVFPSNTSSATVYTLSVSNAAGAAATCTGSATASISVVAAPLIVSFGPALSSITAGNATTLTAVFSNGTGSVDQSIGAVNTSSAVSTGNLAATTTFTLTVTNGAGASVTARATVNTVAAPSCLGVTLTPSATNVTLGKTATLTASAFAGGNGTITNNQDAGAQTIPSGGVVSSGALGTIATYVFTLTIDNGAPGAGHSCSVNSAGVNAIAAPAITSFSPAVAAITAGNTTQVTASFSGSGSVNQGVGAVTSGAAKSTGTLNVTTIFLLTVSNAAGDSVTAQTTVSVVAAPSCAGVTLTPSASNVTLGKTVSLVASAFSGGTGTVTDNQDSGAQLITSGGTISSGALATLNTYLFTLTIDNGVTGSNHSCFVSSAGVVAVAVPTITSFAPALTTITAGNPTTLTGVFAGTGSVSPTVGAVTTAVAKSTGNLVITTTFTLTVSNAAGDSVTAQTTVSVVAAPSCAGVTLTPFASTVTQGKTVTLTASAFTGGTGIISNNLDSSNQTITSGGSTSSAALTTIGNYTFTLTIDNGVTGSGHSCSVNATAVTVVAPPSIASFTATYASLANNGAATFNLNGVFTGTGTVDQGVSGVSTGVNKAVTVTANTTYTLSVTNAASAPAVTATVTVALAGSFGAGAATPLDFGRFGATAVRAQGKLFYGYGGTDSAGTAPNVTGLTETVTGIVTGPVTLSSVGRFRAASIELDTGNVLVVGGAASTFAELVNPNPAGAPSFTTTSAMGVAHNSVALAELLNGQVAVVCGGATTGKETELYDPAAGTFAAAAGLPAMQTARATGCAAATFQAGARIGQVLVVGGGTGGGTMEAVTMTGTVTSTSLSQAYAATADLQFPVAVSLLNGKVLIVGGSTDGTPAHAVSNAVLVDGAGAVTNAGSGNMGIARMNHTATLLPNGKVLIVGGANATGATGVKAAEVYDPTSNTFSPAPPLTTARWMHTATAQQDGTVLVAGGVASASELYTP